MRDAGWGDSTEGKLAEWLSRYGLRANPFAIWSADLEHDLPGYYLDLGTFDDLLAAKAPTIVFAARGCGKTAQRQMLAAQCLPQLPGATRLAINYAYMGFAQALDAHGGDPGAITAADHVASVIAEGLAELALAAQVDGKLAELLAEGPAADRLARYNAVFAPQLAGAMEPPGGLIRLSPPGLLRDFAMLLRQVGVGEVMVLMDGLDELPTTAQDPEAATNLLRWLLGAPPLLDSCGVAFKFFLPQELEPVLRTRSWFRADRVAIRRITWTPALLRRMIGQRLVHFAQDRNKAYTRLGALCDDDLAGRIDDELSLAAGGLPRAAIMLADLLLHRHCQREAAPERIAAATWDGLKADWPRLSLDMLNLRLPGLARDDGSADAEGPAQPLVSPLGWPVLEVDPKQRQAWLGGHEITQRITAQDYRVLAALYRRAGRLCTKDHLADEAWPEAEGGVSDQAIAASLSRLRKVLGQKNVNDGYIQTFKDRGYVLHPAGFKAE